MNAPRLESCYFEATSLGRWTRMARVLQTTAEAHCPDWRLSIRPLRLRLDDRSEVPRSWQANTQKLGEWARVVAAAEDGARVLLMDVDTFILRRLDDVWAMDFDVAYTTKRIGFPFNAGVIFLRVSERTRTFMAAWVAANTAVLNDPRPRVEWVRQFGGVNQSALGQLLGSPTVAGIQILELPCQEWNCEDTTWRKYDPEVTRIAHVKGALRRACLSPMEDTIETAALAGLWRSIEAECSSRRRVSA